MSESDLEKLEDENIPYTMRKKRQEFFENKSQKVEINIAENEASSTS